MKLSGKAEMSELKEARNQQAEGFIDETMDLLDSLSNRTSDTAESIVGLTDEMEELSSEVKSLLDDLRTLQSRVGQPAKDRLDPLIDQLEAVYGGLETAIWTMDCATKGLPQDTELLGILE